MGHDRTIWTVRRRVRWKRVCRFAPRHCFLLTVNLPPFVLECWYSTERGYTPALLWRTDRGDRLSGSLFPTLERLVKKKNAKTLEPGQGPVHVAEVESNVLAKCPNIIAHCAVTRYDDGDPRMPGWITLKTLGSAWVIQIKDPDSACSMTATAARLDDALALADLLLGSDEAPWEPDPWLKRNQTKQNKKA